MNPTCPYCGGELLDERIIDDAQAQYPGAKRTRYGCVLGHPVEIEITTFMGFPLGAWVRLDDGDWETLTDVLHRRDLSSLWRPPR